MASYTEQEKRTLHSISIVEILARYGRRLDHTRGGLYYSPFREESTPSFHINEAMNTWYDYGTGEGGTLVDFVCRFAGCPRGEAYDWLASFRGKSPGDGCAPALSPAPRGTGRQSRIVVDSAFRRFTRRRLVEYAASRAVSAEVLARYCEEVVYHVDSAPGRSFYAVGFRNNSGGYALRSAVAKRCTSSDFTTIGPDGRMCTAVNSGRVLVFEGFFDFLSWLTHAGRETPQYDCCILNSVTNLGRALPWIMSHGSVAAFMDNDRAGRDALRRMTGGVPAGARDGVCVYDMSGFYEGYNDLNEMLSAKLEAPGR